MAPMASNITESVQSSSSQPPATITSCLPQPMSSAALPMQWTEVEQADAIESLTPLIWKLVASSAEGPEHMAFGTSNVPLLRGSLLRVVSSTAAIACAAGPSY